MLVVIYYAVMLYAEVIVKRSTPSSILTYAVPAGIVPYIRVGSSVTVPIRRAVVEGVVSLLSKSLPTELRDTTVKEIVGIERGVFFSSEQLAVNREIANASAVSQSQVATAALQYPANENQQLSAPAAAKPINLIAGMQERFEYYTKIIKKYPHKKILIVCGFVEYAKALHKQLLLAQINSSFLDSQDLSTKKGVKFYHDSKVVVTTSSGLFLPLRSNDIIIGEAINHSEAAMLRRPYLDLYLSLTIRAKCERLQLVVGAAFPKFGALKSIVGNEALLVTSGKLTKLNIQKQTDLAEQLSSFSDATIYAPYEKNTGNVGMKSNAILAEAKTYRHLVVVGDALLKYSLIARVNSVLFLRELFGRSEFVTVITKNIDHPFWSILSEKIGRATIQKQLLISKQHHLPPFVVTARAIADITKSQLDQEKSRAISELENAHAEVFGERVLRSNGSTIGLELTFSVDNSDAIEQIKRTLGASWFVVISR